MCNYLLSTTKNQLPKSSPCYYLLIGHHQRTATRHGSTQPPKIGHRSLAYSSSTTSPADHHELLWGVQEGSTCDEQKLPASKRWPRCDPASLPPRFRKTPAFPATEHFPTSRCSPKFFQFEWIPAARTTRMEPVSVSATGKRLWDFDQFSRDLEYHLQWIDFQRQQWVFVDPTSAASSIGFCVDFGTSLIDNSADGATRRSSPR